MARAAGLVLAALLLAQSPRDVPRTHADTSLASGAIRGRVVSAATGDPLANAEVRVSGMPDRPRPDDAPATVLTDASGRYEIPAVAGHLVVTATKAGYAEGSFGARHTGEPPRAVTVANGASVDSIDIALRRAAAISGRIVDEFGDPVVSGEVTVSLLKRIDGRLRIQSSRRTATDDRGEYRVGGLDAGSYLVALGGGGGTATRWALTYYPGTFVRAEARAVSLQTGDDQSGIDFAVSPANAHAVTVSGRVIDTDGHASAANVILAVGGDRPADTASSLELRVGDAGTFTAAVEPGDIIAVAVDRDNHIGLATFTAADADVSGVTLSLTNPGRIAGRVVFDGVGAPSPADVEIVARPTVAYVISNGSSPKLGYSAVRPRPDGTFELKNLMGSRDLHVRTMPVGWHVRSITIGGRDVLDIPLEFKGGEDFAGVEIVLAKEATRLEGSVVDDRDRPVVDYELIVVPEDRTDRRASHRRWVRPDQAGHFVVEGLPPARYLVAAVDAVDGAVWPDEEYVQRFRSTGTAVVLAAGVRQTRTLHVTRLP
jgi:hypothetical protein